MPQIDKLNIRQQNSVHKVFLSLNLNNNICNEHYYINDREEKDYCPNCGGKLSHGTCNICHEKESFERL